MSPSKVWKQIETDHPYNTAACSTSQKVKQLTNKVKALQQKVCRQNKQIKNMKQLLLALKDLQLIVDKQHALLKHNFGHMANHLFNNQLKQAQCKSVYGQQYENEIKQFAMTLH